MSTIIDNLNLARLQSLRKAQAAEAKKGVESETTPLAEFNDRAGMLMHHLKAHPHTSLANRGKTLSNQRRQLQATEMSTLPGSGDQDDDEQLFSSGRMKLVGELQRGGEQAAKQWLSQNHDLLERHELLRHALNNSSDQDKPALGRLMEDLKKEHGAELSSVLRDADALKTAVHKMDTMSHAAGAGDSAALRGFRSLFNSNANNKLNEPSDALSLATRLQNRFGVDQFANALKEMRSQLAAQMRSIDKSSELGPKMWLSMSDAANFRAIQSAHATAGDLRKSLSDANIVPRTKEGSTTIALLGVPELGSNMAGKLADDVVGRKDLSSQQKANMYRLCARAVETLPLTLWPDDKHSQRMDLISKLRNLSGSSASEVQKQRETKEAKLERRLREQASLLKTKK